MNYLKDPNFLRQVIMDHYQYPRNKRDEKDYEKVHMSTDSCIDDITVSALIKDDVIVDVAFVGEACTIATSSVSIMTELLKGKHVSEGYKIIMEFNKMLRMQDFDESILGEAVALRNVSRQPHRITCADLGWRGMVLLLEKEASYE